MLQPFRLLEHVFAEQALEEPGRGNRAEQVKMPGADRLGELHGIPRTLDIDPELTFGIRVQIVDRCQMEKMGRLLADFLAVSR